MAEDLDKLWAQAKPVAARQDEDLSALWEKAAPKVQTDYSDAPDGLTWLEKFGAGVGIGAKNMFKSAEELASRLPGLSGIAPDARMWAEEKRAEAALMRDPAHSWHVGTLPSWLPLVGGTSIDPTWGNVGNFVGETASTAPIGGLAGGVARGTLAKLGVKAGVNGLAGLAARVLPAVAEGSAQGTVLGGPDNRTLGALLGGGFAGVGSAGAQKLGSLARGFVKPTPAAAALMREGVPLSLGQMDPGGALSKMEEAGRHSVLGGQTISEARQLPRDVMQLVAAKKSLAPGEALPAGPVRPGDFIEQMHEGFNRAYGDLKQTPMPTRYEGVPVQRAMKDAFRTIAMDPSIMADEATRNMVNDFLQNQTTVLKNVRQFELPGAAKATTAGGLAPVRPLLPASELGIRAPKGQWAEDALSEATANGRRPVAATTPEPEAQTFTTAEPMLAIRSAIREELRRPGLAGTAHGKMLQNAQNVLTNALEEGMGPEGATRLRALDSQYHNLMVLDRAVAAAKDSPFGFSPAQLNAAAQQGLGAVAKARGYGGPLRDLAALAREALDERAPRTGAIKQTLPLGLNHAAGPLMSFLNGPGRNFALGVTGPQRAAVSLGDLLQSALPNRSGAGAFLPGPNAFLAPLEVPER